MLLCGECDLCGCPQERGGWTGLFPLGVSRRVGGRAATDTEFEEVPRPGWWRTAGGQPRSTPGPEGACNVWGTGTVGAPLAWVRLERRVGDAVRGQVTGPEPRLEPDWDVPKNARLGGFCFSSHRVSHWRLCSDVVPDTFRSRFSHLQNIPLLADTEHSHPRSLLWAQTP